MNEDTQQLGKLDVLLGALTSGGLDAVQQKDLSQILRRSERARDRYLDYVELHASLTRHFDSASGGMLDGLVETDTLAGGRDVAVAEMPTAPDVEYDGVDPAVIEQLLAEDEEDELKRRRREADNAIISTETAGHVVRPQVKSKKWNAVWLHGSDGRHGAQLPMPSFLWIAAVIALVTVSYYALQPAADNRSFVASLSRSVGAEWASGLKSAEPGDALRSGDYELSKGRLYITFSGGAQVGLAAPAKFTLVDSKTIRLSRGKLVCFCQESARGFSVETYSATVVDLGTEFGVLVDTEGVTEVHVLAGKVAVRPVSGAERFGGHFELVGGQASRIDEHGKDVTHIDLALNTFGSVRPLLDRNLIVNGDFETDEPGEVIREAQDARFRVIEITGWENPIGATTLLYHQGPSGGQFADPAKHPVPTDHGRCFFIGIGKGRVSQRIDVSAVADLIDAKQVRFELSGWTGGYEDQVDNLAIAATALDHDDQPIGVVTMLGPMSREDRNNTTGYWYHSNRADLPPGTRHVRIDLISDLEVDLLLPGSRTHKADAYADNVSFKLTVKPSKRGL